MLVGDRLPSPVTLGFPITRFPDLCTPAPNPDSSTRIPKRLVDVIPDRSQQGPVHARFSRGWAETGVDLSPSFVAVVIRAWLTRLAVSATISWPSACIPQPRPHPP